jgi:CheY-like chemotaxis protein
LIIADVQMPVMDGTALLAALRATDAGAAIPVAMVSGSKRVPGLDVPLLRKPVSVDALLDLVDRFCGSPASLAP